jgi:hypothetical protein
VVVGKRLKKFVDGLVQPLVLARPDPQPPCVDRHISSGRNDVNVVRFHQRVVAHLDHRQRCRATENLRERAGMLRSQVLDDDERHAGVDRYRTQQLRQSFDTTRGSADADDRKRFRAFSFSRMLGLDLLR